MKSTLIPYGFEIRKVLRSSDEATPNLEVARRRFSEMFGCIQRELPEQDLRYERLESPKERLVWYDRISSPNASARLLLHREGNHFRVHFSFYRPESLEAWANAANCLGPCLDWSDLWLPPPVPQDLSPADFFLRTDVAFDGRFRGELVDWFRTALESGESDLIANLPFALLGNPIYYADLKDLFLEYLPRFEGDSYLLDCLRSGIGLMEGEWATASESDAWFDYRDTGLDHLFVASVL